MKLIKSIKKKVKVVGHSVEGRVLTFSPNVEYMRWLTIGSCRYVQCYRSFINLHTTKFNTKMNKEILQKAIDKWGKETQINKIQEEALELALVLNQRKCPTKDVEQMEANLYDELADMKIMMAQAEMLFDADRINERVKFKLDKLQSKYLS